MLMLSLSFCLSPKLFKLDADELGYITLKFLNASSHSLLLSFKLLMSNEEVYIGVSSVIICNCLLSCSCDSKVSMLSARLVPE